MRHGENIRGQLNEQNRKCLAFYEIVEGFEGSRKLQPVAEILGDPKIIFLEEYCTC